MIFYCLKCLRTGGRGRGHRRRRLDIVGLQVLLEVEDLELILLRQRQELAQRRIGLDDLLVHQLVRLGVGADTRRDLRAADKGALGDAEERAERVRDGRGLREDRLLLDDGLAALRRGSGRAAAATLLGALELTGNLLLELLHVGEDGAERGAQEVDLLDKGVELANNVDVLLRRGDRRGLRRRNGGGDDRGNNNGGGNNRGGNNGGGDGRGDGRGGGFLGSRFLSGGGAHGCLYQSPRNFLETINAGMLTITEDLYSSILVVFDQIMNVSMS
jgi:hypothetical protein